MSSWEVTNQLFRLLPGLLNYRPVHKRVDMCISPICHNRELHGMVILSIVNPDKFAV